MQKNKLLFLFILFVNLTFSQTPISIHLTEKDGVPGTDFYDIIEDDKGYLWIDGDKGLFRFDGKTYKNYQHKDQRGLSVFQVKKDRNNTIWYVNLSGQVFYIKNDNVFLFQDFKKDFDGKLPTLTCYKNYLILFTTKQMLIYDIRTKKEVSRFSNNLKGSNSILNIEPSIFKNNLYFGRINNLKKLNLNNFKLQENIAPTYVKNVLLNATSIQFLDNKGLMVVRKKKDFKAYHFNIGENYKISPIAHNLPNTRIVKIKKIKNQLWYCSDNGVYVCEMNNDALTVKKHLFPNTFITDVIVDKDQNYWFTTINKSIYVIPNIEINSTNISLNPNTVITKTNLGKQNELLITTNKSDFIKYDVSQKKVKLIKFQKGKKIFNTVYNPYKNEYLINTHLHSYLYDANFNLKSIDNTYGSSKGIQFINKNRFLVSASNYVSIYDIKKNRIFHLNKRGYTAHYDKLHSLRYFAIVDGLFVLDNDLKRKNILYHNKPIYATSITQTKDGIVWCATFKNGVFAIKNKHVIAHYNTENGLLSNNISIIKADGITLWIAGDNGIQKMNTVNKTFQSITKSEGVVSYNYNGLEIIDNQVFVSTPEHIISFDKNNVFNPFKTKEVFITSVTLNHQEQLLKSNYTFEYDTRNIKFNFAAVGFSAKNKAQFKYRLKGFNKDWTTTSVGENYVQYNTLPAGNYIFQIQNISDNKTEVLTKKIHLKVTKPFWLKWWFYALLPLPIFLFLILINKRNAHLKEEKLKKELKQLKIEKQLVNLQLENFRSQMNPHFIFNALNSIQEFIITNNKNLASDYLGQFADLIRTYLEQSTKNEILLSEEINTLKQYLSIEKIRFEDNLEYRINVAFDTTLSNIYIPTMLIQPYVENALKHGLLHKKGKGIVSIDFAKKENYIICTITDNGVGREKAKEIQKRRIKKYNSFALKASEIRVNLLNQGQQQKISITIHDLYTDKQATGTQVVIKVPHHTIT